jgi:protein-S-isoprenylcysteine O-methyltransferase Ste14
MRPEQVALAVLMATWGVLGAMLVHARIRARRGADGAAAGAAAGDGARRRDLASWGGIVLQGIGFSLAFGARRPPGTALLPGIAAPALSWVFALFVMLLAIASTVFAGWALRTLDKQWSLTARVRADHALVTHGPFAHVRHPIYTALLGLLVATGLACADGRALLLASAVYLAGTLWRADREERLLRGMFGAAYDAYAARVPRLLPSLRPRAP